MKKLLLFSLLLFSIIKADEFVVESFHYDESDISARVQSKIDVNGEVCAIIKVRTALENVKFHSNQLSDLEQKTGEYWLYVSPGIRYLEIMKDGFSKMGYEIPTAIETQNVYIMKLTNKNQTRLRVISKPVDTKGATIFINGEKQEKVTPATFIVSPGTYSVTVRQNEYQEVSRDITVDKNEKKDAIFNLMPSKLQVISKPAESKGANIIINGNQQTEVTPSIFNVTPGKYYITLKHPDFLDITKDTTIRRNQRVDMIFNMTPYEGSTLQRYRSSKKRRWIGLAGGIAMIGAGVAFNYLAERSYDNCNSSQITSRANDYYNKYETYYVIRNISYSISIGSLIYGAINWFKEKNYKSKLEK